MRQNNLRGMTRRVVRCRDRENGCKKRKEIHDETNMENGFGIVHGGKCGN